MSACTMHLTHTEQSLESVSEGAVVGGVVGGLVGVVLLAVTVVIIVVLVRSKQSSLKYDGRSQPFLIVRNSLFLTFLL